MVSVFSSGLGFINSSGWVLEAHLDFLVIESSIDVADRYLCSVQHTLSITASNPSIGSVRTFMTPGLTDVRLWPVKDFRKYLIFYRTDSNAIEVIRILHAARDYHSLFDI